MLNRINSLKMYLNFEMIKVLRAFLCDFLHFKMALIFKQKSTAQILRFLSFSGDGFERYIFIFLWQNDYYNFEVDKRVRNLLLYRSEKPISSFQNERHIIISKLKKSYHPETKVFAHFKTIVLLKLINNKSIKKSMTFISEWME